MANSQSNTVHNSFATVDTAPGAAGYGCLPVKVYFKNNKATFSIRGTGTMDVTLQYICAGDSAYTDYETYTDNTRLTVEEFGADTAWQALVKNGDYTSGSKTFGFSY